jgi:ubiquinone/menaquinone biosynthesis C-methylase UbiE
MTCPSGVPRTGLLAQYALIAARYEREVIPAFGPLAADFAAWVAGCLRAQQAHELDDPFDLPPQLSSASQPSGNPAGLHAVDLGTGTGVLLRALSQHVPSVIGVDVSAAMLTAARHTLLLPYVVADIHHLPLRSGSMALVTSTFGLNAARPKPVLRECYRVLRAGRGLLMVQEWGVQDPLSQAVVDTVAEFTPDSFALPPDLAEMYDAPKPWYDQLQDVEDFYDMLKYIGFRLVWVREAVFVAVRLTVDQFMTYKLAWASRWLAVQAMPDQRRLEFYAELRRRLVVHSSDGEWLDWSPDLFRVCAQK